MIRITKGNTTIEVDTAPELVLVLAELRCIAPLSPCQWERLAKMMKASA